MITVGMDLGAANIKVVILKDGVVLAKGMGSGGINEKDMAPKVLNDVLAKAGIKRDDVDSFRATGAGVRSAPSPDDTITVPGAAARAAVHLFPSARTVIDVGAEEGRAIKCDAQGRVKDFAVNEKCAAGAGAFIEAMSRALEISINDMGKLGLSSTAELDMNAQCAVFAESEVVSLIHAKVPRADIARSIHDAIAERIVSLVRRVGVEKDVVLLGGMGKDPSFVEALKRGLATDILVPEDPEYAGALGAALAAAAGMVEQKVEGTVVEKQR